MKGLKSTFIMMTESCIELYNNYTGIKVNNKNKVLVADNDLAKTKMTDA